MRVAQLCVDYEPKKKATELTQTWLSKFVFSLITKLYLVEFKLYRIFTIIHFFLIWSWMVLRFVGFFQFLLPLLLFVCCLLIFKSLTCWFMFVGMWMELAEAQLNYAFGQTDTLLEALEVPPATSVEMPVRSQKVSSTLLFPRSSIAPAISIRDLMKRFETHWCQSLSCHVLFLHYILKWLSTYTLWTQCCDTDQKMNYYKIGH